MDKDQVCKRHRDGCRLVSGGMVCTHECEWIARMEPGHFSDAKVILQRISESSKKKVA
jgi:hypothetical protein